MPDLEIDESMMNQFVCPTGEQGRKIAALMNEHHDQLTSWGLSHVKIQSDAVILDVGVGGGRTVGKLAGLAVDGRVFGIDYSKDMVEYSKSQNRRLIAEGKISLLQGVVQNLSFQNGLFDLVTAVETYYFWPNLPQAFREINRVLKAGGKLLIISEMVKDGTYEVENAEMITQVQVKLYSMQELEGMLEAEGFKVQVSRKPNSPWNVVVAQKS
jgi:ubiquinone/menaquinone biosynthesis C-methylase UbiE